MKIEDGEHTYDKADRSTLAAYRRKEYTHYKKGTNAAGKQS